MKVALLPLDGGDSPAFDASLVEFMTCAGWTDLLSAQDVRGIILGPGSDDALRHFFADKHRHFSLCLLPVWTTNPPPPEIAALIEGVAPSSKEVLAKVREMMPLLDLLNRSETFDYEEILLRWLFVRPDRVVEPLFDYRSSHVYSYPLLDAFFPGAGGVRSWLASLVGRALLEPRQLVDRVRLCPSCGQGHINFIDRCPNCQCIDIRKHDFLHCFSCGYVAPDKDFLGNNALSCPKCRAQLRHIGADYDKPLENHRCEQCATVFADPEVVARCFDCGHVAAPDGLEVQNISRFVLGEQGRMAVRNGSLKDVYAVFDRERFASPKHFQQSIDWLRDMLMRYGSPHFTLLHLSVRNAAELVEQIGRPATVILLEEFSRRLRAIMRDTDIPTRLDSHRIAILMPHTNKEKALLAVKRISAVSGKAGHEKLQVDFGILSVPEDNSGKEGGSILLAELCASSTGSLE